MSKFSENEFEQKLFKLKDSHDSVASLSNWCLSNVDHHAKIVATWLGTLKKVKIDHRVLLFYLANDIVQYSKKKGLAFVGSFAPALQKATTMVRDPNIRNKILRIFKIWDERNIYDESFLVDLSSLLTRGHKSASRIDLEDFQPNLLYSRLKSCQTLEEDTDSKMKTLVENQMPLTDTERLRTTLKNRKASEDVIVEIDEGIKKIGAFIKALESEIKERSGLIDLLEISEQYYDKEFGEAKIVSNAYKCFTNRVKTVKKKLDEKIEALGSPVPTPSPTAPSPEPEPLDSTDDRMGFDFAPALGGASFMDGSLFANQSVATEFPSYYLSGQQSINDSVDHSLNERDNIYSPESSYNEQESFTNQLMSQTVPSHATVSHSGQIHAAPQQGVAPPPINIPPVFNYFRPISSTTPPPPPPLPPVAETIPGLDANTSIGFNTTYEDPSMISDCSSEGLKIEVISPSKEPSLSTLLESMVSDGNTSLPPPPAPPAIDFGSWGGNPDYWDTPESPPLFEKEGLPNPSLAEVGLTGENDTDMRTKDVDHRNLISLTGGAEADWEFSQTGGPEGNEDMEMSDEDVGNIEDVSNELIKSSTNYSVYPMKPIVNAELSANGKSPSEMFRNDVSKPPFQRISSLETKNSLGNANNIDNQIISPLSAPSYQIPPPPPPPMPLGAQPRLQMNQGAMWANRFPPPPAPPFEPPRPQTTPNQFDTVGPPLFQNQPPSNLHRFETPTAPRTLEPLRQPFPLQGGNNFRFPSQSPQRPPFPMQERLPTQRFEAHPLMNNPSSGHPIPRFESQSPSHQNQSPRPLFPHRVFRPRNDAMNSPQGPSQFFRGSPQPERFPGYRFRPYRQRFPPQRF